MSTQEKEISTSTLNEFLEQVEAAVKDGYTFDYESNARYPQAFPHRYFVVMVKDTSEVPKTPVQETQSQPAKRGPKPKTAETD